MRISDWSSDVCSSDLLDRSADPFDIGAHHVHADAAARNRSNLLRRGESGPETEIANLLVGQRLALVLGRKAVRQRFFLDELGRTSCRERVCQYWYLSGLAISLQNKIT